jgi:flagella basal body P-ring formation protein FlgA
MIAWLFLLGIVNQSTVCQTVSGPMILGEDLARAVPAFSPIPRDTVIGYSPAAGTQRNLDWSELAGIGRKYKISVPSDSSACFEWKLQPLTADAVRQAMREGLRMPGVKIDILAMSNTVVPAGRLIFPSSNISASSIVDPSTPVTWRGEIRYGGSRQFAIWARVRLSVTTTRVVATEALLPEQVITSSQVRLETYDDFPLKRNIARNLDEVVGKVTRRPIRPGAPVLKMDLVEPFLVRRGDLVEVTVVSGAAEILLQALADTSGRQGELVSLTNPRTGKMFRARVGGKGKAIMIASPPGFLARMQ